MTALDRYLAEAVPNGADDVPAPPETQPGYDELAGPDGQIRPSWQPLLDDLDAFADTDLVRAQREVARLLADDGVTYTPTPASSISIVDRPSPSVAAELSAAKPWKLDPLPLVLDAAEWSGLEVGVVQRAELLAAILSDLYGAQRLLAEQHIPPRAVLDHDEFLRPLVGIEALSTQRLFTLAADLGRDPAGQWKVLADRTQAPSARATRWRTVGSSPG